MKKISNLLNITQIPLRWLVHGIFFPRIQQMLFPKKIGAKLNLEAENEFSILNENKLNRDKRDNRIIISLTTIPTRINKIKLVVTRMMNQTIRPDKIIVYLDEIQEEEFIFNDDLKKLIYFGLEIRFVKDIGPHTKYFYSLQDFSDDIVITVDDDIIYSHLLIETLVKSYKKYPDCISANIVTNFLIKDGMLEASTKWRQKFKYGIGNEYSIAYGVGGVLYPPKLLPKETFDEYKIRKLCLFADDLWLKAIENKHKIKVVKTWNGDKLFKYFITVDGSQEVGLRKINDFEDRNIAYLNKLLPIFWNLE